MINLIETPQRSDSKVEYVVNGDVLTVNYNNQTETFDFTDFPDGEAEEIGSELPINCVIGANKSNGIVNVTVIRLYGEEEKEVFEIAENKMEI